MTRVTIILLISHLRGKARCMFACFPPGDGRVRFGGGLLLRLALAEQPDLLGDTQAATATRKWVTQVNTGK